MRHMTSTTIRSTPALTGTPRALLRTLSLAAALALAAPAFAADAVASLQVTGLHISSSAGLQFNWLASSAYQTLFAESRDAGGLGGNNLAEPEPGFSWAAQAVSTSTDHATAAALGGKIVRATPCRQ